MHVSVGRMEKNMRKWKLGEAVATGNTCLPTNLIDIVIIGGRQIWDSGFTSILAISQGGGWDVIADAIWDLRCSGHNRSSVAVAFLFH